MGGRLDRLRARAETAPLSWDPVLGGKRVWPCFEDDKTYDLGADPTGARFAEISGRMLTGRYYPSDAVRVSGRFLDEGRELRVGDRLLQLAPLFYKWGGPLIASSTEMYVVEKRADHCKIGYVTTTFHEGRGIWSSELTRKEGRLWLHVLGVAMPHGLLFWLGLPLARYTQKRAWRRAVETFTSIS